MLRVLDEHGRDALGAELTMTVGARAMRRDVRAAYSYLASNDPRVHVGLGTGDQRQATSACGGPTASAERFGDIAADKITVLRRGAGRSY